jgi:protoporphyrinogen IX oxidase
MDGLASYYLVFKALHIAFMVTWFAGLFYLPRLFIYHVEAAAEPAACARFRTMEKRLFAIMTIGAVLTALFGLAMLTANPALLDRAWFRLKAVLIVGLVLYHYRCHAWIGRLGNDTPAANTRWLRWFNEIPAFFLLAIILLAVLKSP